MNPAWVMVAIALAGMVFQGGIGWAILGRFREVERKVEKHTIEIPKIDSRVDQHEWRITNHDQRLHTHEEQLDRLRGLK